MRTRTTLLIVLCTLLAAVAPAGAVGAPDASTPSVDADAAVQQEVPDCSFPVTSTDATGTEVTVEETPETVTTLGASAAQTMWEIGGKEQVVGLSSNAHYLADAESRTNVSASGFGYSTEAVVGTEADLVLAANIVPEETVTALRDAGMTVYQFEAATSIEDVANKTTMIGKLTGNCEGAAEANAWMNANVETAQEVTADAESPELLIPLSGGSLVGGGTFINAMVEAAGGTNLAVEAFDSSYPYQVSDETILELNPEMLVLQEGLEGLITQEPYASTTAGENNARRRRPRRGRGAARTTRLSGTKTAFRDHGFFSRMIENVVYPAYIDAAYSRSEGRRVPIDEAVEEPTVDEIAKAVQQVGYDAVVERDKSYSREYEQRGRVLVQGADDASKNDLVQAIAAYVAILRD